MTLQTGPFGEDPPGRFLTSTPLPSHVLYLEPAFRRMRVEAKGQVLAESDDARLLHETAALPIAYFPMVDVDTRLLEHSETVDSHPVLGRIQWWSLRLGEHLRPNIAWSYPEPPPDAAAMSGLMAFDWDAVDAVFEEDQQVFGHAADPYHRVDVRAASRHVTVRVGNHVIAETYRPYAVFETGLPVRWYIPVEDVHRPMLWRNDDQSFCPYKGQAVYFDVVVGGVHLENAAWSYPDALPEAFAIEGCLSFDPSAVEVLVDGALLPKERADGGLPDNHVSEAEEFAA